MKYRPPPGFLVAVGSGLHGHDRREKLAGSKSFSFLERSTDRRSPPATNEALRCGGPWRRTTRSGSDPGGPRGGWLGSAEPRRHGGPPALRAAPASVSLAPWIVWRTRRRRDARLNARRPLRIPCCHFFSL
jgi:hypothetical protein